MYDAYCCDATTCVFHNTLSDFFLFLFPQTLILIQKKIYERRHKNAHTPVSQAKLFDWCRQARWRVIDEEGDKVFSVTVSFHLHLHRAYFFPHPFRERGGCAVCDDKDDRRGKCNKMQASEESSSDPGTGNLMHFFNKSIRRLRMYSCTEKRI